MATLTYMPAEHVPVLAPELIALVDPGPGDVVVGAGDRLELWDRGHWNEHRTALLSGVAEITADVKLSA